MAWVSSLHVGTFEVTIDTTQVRAIMHGGDGWAHGAVWFGGQETTPVVCDETYAVVKAALAV